MVVVALNTGMRKSEILNLEWERVNFSRGVIQLETTKNGSRREIPMNQAVQSRAPGCSPRSVRTAFEGALERAGVKNFHFHDLRHTFASWLTMKGRPLREVQELLGHKSIRMTERYSHLAPERLRDAWLPSKAAQRQHKANRSLLQSSQLRATINMRFQEGSARATPPVPEP